jgi:hypothetical protein
MEESMADKRVDFVVRVEGALDAKAQARIAAKINAAVLEELPSVDFGGPTQALIPNKEWLGIWLRKYLAGGQTPEVPTLIVNQKGLGG